MCDVKKVHVGLDTALGRSKCYAWLCWIVTKRSVCEKRLLGSPCQHTRAMEKLWLQHFSFFLHFDIFWDAWHEVAEVFQVSWQVYFSSWIFWKNVCTKDNNKPYPSSKHHASTKHRSTRHTSSLPLHFLFGGFDDSNFVAAEQIGSFSPDKLIKSKRVDCS